MGLASCDEKLSDITGPTPNLKPTFASIQSEILTPKCATCHTGTGTRLPGIMNLREGSAYASLVGVASIEKPALLRVAPGDPENSYIYHKLEGAPGIGGARMPLNGTPLTDGQIRVIERWIETGAAND
jgi:mono/diheme cytochrome c family protein